jgi:adenine-specific DNA-methyltransferase
MRQNDKQYVHNGSSKYKLPVEKTVNNKKILYGSNYRENFDAVLVNSDILEFLDSSPIKDISLVMTSPPYNLLKPYEQKLDFDDYISWQKEIILKIIKKMKSNGSICWQVGNYIFEKEVFKELGLKLRNRIIWHFGHGLHASNRFSGRYETILWFSLSDDYTFNLPFEVRVDQKYPGKRAFKGPKKAQVSSNILGKNPSDLWDSFRTEWEEGIWNIPNVKNQHLEKTIHTSQYPIELVERLILALTNEGSDLVFDPFMGVGTTQVASCFWNRKTVGVDKEKAYTDIAFERIISALNGNLKRRPLGMPIFQPASNCKVAQIPPEWKNDI